MTEYVLSGMAMTTIAQALTSGNYTTEINDKGSAACIEIQGVGTIELPAEAIIAVPPEPELLAVVLDRDGNSWQREAGTGSPSWHSLGEHRTWRELNEQLGPLVRLVPEPPISAAAPLQPSELPLEIRDREGFVAFRVDFAPDARPYPAGWVHAGNSAVELSAPELEQAAAAMQLVARMCRDAKR